MKKAGSGNDLLYEGAQDTMTKTIDNTDKHYLFKHEQKIENCVSSHL